MDESVTEETQRAVNSTARGLEEARIIMSLVLPVILLTGEMPASPCTFPL